MSRKPKIYHLDAGQLRLIQETIFYDKRPGVRRKAMAIKLLHQGFSPPQVADILNVKVQTVYSWSRLWEMGQLDRLCNAEKVRFQVVGFR